jgi:hypothetical protein
MTPRQRATDQDATDDREEVQGYMVLQGPGSTTLTYNPFGPMLPGPTFPRPKPLMSA